MASSKASNDKKKTPEAKPTAKAAAAKAAPANAAMKKGAKLDDGALEKISGGGNGANKPKG